MSFQSDGDKDSVEQLKAAVADLNKVVTSQNQLIMELNQRVTTNTLELLDLMFLFQRDQTKINKVVCSRLLKPGEHTDQSINQLFAMSDKANEELNAGIMKAKAKCMPLVPPLPPLTERPGSPGPSTPEG